MKDWPSEKALVRSAIRVVKKRYVTEALLAVAWPTGGGRAEAEGTPARNIGCGGRVVGVVSSAFGLDSTGACKAHSRGRARRGVAIGGATQ